MQVPPRPAWHARAACRGVDPDLFFPAAGRSARPARDVCAGCPVIHSCLDEALADPMLDGIWGGTTPTERQHLRERTA